MSALTIVILIFSVLGALDWLLGNKFGLGSEFERAFMLFTPMAFSMLGVLVLAPAFGVWLMPFFEWFYSTFGIDPSIIPASLFANDMGGMTLAQTVMKNEEIGNFNAFVVSSMMGCMFSFTIPFALGLVKKEQHKDMFFGMICGIITIPIGCFIAGLLCGIGVLDVLLTLLPLIIFAVLLGFALIYLPNVCIKGFAVFGHGMRLLSISGLVCAVFTFLTKIELSQYFDTFENAAFVCVNACATLSGMLPLMFVVSKILGKPLVALGDKLGINGHAALALVGCLVSNVMAFSAMERMDKKGVALNAAFAVSAAFTFGGHLALTMAFDGTYVLPMIVGKLIAGICAVALAAFAYRGKDVSESA